uniref:Uncharacterized protein n=1 Tax=Parascaris equorum TaxID=6256 RepID=A0A914S0K9_PAREQ
MRSEAPLYESVVLRLRDDSDKKPVYTIDECSDLSTDLASHLQHDSWQTKIGQVNIPLKASHDKRSAEIFNEPYRRGILKDSIWDTEFLVRISTVIQFLPPKGYSDIAPVPFPTVGAEELLKVLASCHHGVPVAYCLKSRIVMREPKTVRERWLARFKPMGLVVEARHIDIPKVQQLHPFDLYYFNDDEMVAHNSGDPSYEKRQIKDH